MMTGHKFATAINCIDGRVQMPVINWMDLYCQVQYVDMITEPGVDNLLVNGSQADVYYIRQKAQFSVERHESQVIAIIGHHDCLGNPVSHEKHLELIKKGADIIESWGFWVRVVGLYVNEWSAVDVICDSEKGQQNQMMRSFL